MTVKYKTKNQKQSTFIFSVINFKKIEQKLTKSFKACVQ